MRNTVITEDLAAIVGAGLDWTRFSGSTVLVTGANGFLPAYMVETLLYLNETTPGGAGVKVVGVVRDAARGRRRFAGYLERGDLELVAHDISRPLQLTGPVDYIIHAASQASPKYYGSDPVGTLSANTLGTNHLLELARAKGTEGFLFFSSGEVYGEVSPERIPTREEDYGAVDPCDVRSCYAESKRMGENICVSWSHQYGVPAKIVRPFHTYGPGLSLDDGRVFADFVAAVVRGRDIVMQSDGSARRAFCYLADATAGFFKVLLEGKNAYPYNVGNQNGEVSILELADLMVGLFPEKGLKVVRREGSSPPGYLKSRISRNCPDIGRMRELGWEPRTTLEEGFTRTIRSILHGVEGA